MVAPVLTNVIVGEATLYIGPANTAMPDDTVALGEAWPVGWTYIGATDAGVTLTVSTNTQDITIEEQSTPALVTVTSKDVTVACALAEDTIANMKTAYGGGTLTTQVAATGTIGKSTLTLSDTLDQLAVGFEGVNPEGFFRRVYIPVVVSVASVGTSYRRAAAKRMYPISLRAICAPSSIEIVDMTAAAL